jgi:hypothetical protein
MGRVALWKWSLVGKVMFVFCILLQRLGVVREDRHMLGFVF